MSGGRLSVQETVDKVSRRPETHRAFAEPAGGRPKAPAAASAGPPRREPRPSAFPLPSLLQFVRSGQRDELKVFTRQRLEELGWTDEVRQLCRGAAWPPSPAALAAAAFCRASP